MNGRVLRMALGAAVLGALTVAGGPLGHVAPVPGDVAGVTVRLAACKPVSGEVPAEHGIEGSAGAVTLAVLSWYEALVGFAGSVAGHAPVYEPLAGKAAAVWLSPLLGPVEVWSGGPLGVLEREALAAREAGDMAGFEAKAAGYWRMMEQALRRRAVHGRERRGGVTEKGVRP